MYKHRPGVLGGCAARREGGMFSGAVYLFGDTRRLGRFLVGDAVRILAEQVRCPQRSPPRSRPPRSRSAPGPCRAVPGASGPAPPPHTEQSSHGRGCRVPQPGCPAAGKAGGPWGARAARPGQLHGAGAQPAGLSPAGFALSKT